MTTNKNIKIVVVCGGVSSEREVSLRSGEAVFKALNQAGYKKVSLFDLKRDNFKLLLSEKPDVCYLALHGEGGEDGCIQGALQLAGIPYTGPGIASSAIAMDKILTKKLLDYSGIPTAKFIEVKKGNITNINTTIKHLIDNIGLPMVLKAPSQGSSIGVVIVNKEEDMSDAICEVFKYGDSLLAEEFLDGVEVTLPILGNKNPKALPIIEITSSNDFYDFESKYTPGMCEHIIPARISESDAKLINDIGVHTYEVVGCTGLSRIDFILDKKKGPMVIEVNTIPGMTEMSLFPDSAKHAGISFPNLVSQIVELATEKNN